MNYNIIMLHPVEAMLRGICKGTISAAEVTEWFWGLWKEEVITGYCKLLTFAKTCFVSNYCQRDVLYLHNCINHLKSYLNQHNTKSVSQLMRTANPACEELTDSGIKWEQEEQWNWNGLSRMCIVMSALVLGAKISQTYKQPGRRRMRRTSAASDDKSGCSCSYCEEASTAIVADYCETKQAFLTAKVCTCYIFH
jgi:hypothetical protein